MSAAKQQLPQKNNTHLCCKRFGLLFRFQGEKWILKDKIQPIRDEVISRSFVEELKRKPLTVDRNKPKQADGRVQDVLLAAGRGSVSPSAPARGHLGVRTQSEGLLELVEERTVDMIIIMTMDGSVSYCSQPPEGAHC